MFFKAQLFPSLPMVWPLPRVASVTRAVLNYIYIRITISSVERIRHYMIFCSFLKRNLERFFLSFRFPWPMRWCNECRSAHKLLLNLWHSILLYARTERAAQWKLLRILQHSTPLVNRWEFVEYKETFHNNFNALFNLMLQPKSVKWRLMFFSASQFFPSLRVKICQR